MSILRMSTILNFVLAEFLFTNIFLYLPFLRFTTLCLHLTYQSTNLSGENDYIGKIYKAFMRNGLRIIYGNMSQKNKEFLLCNHNVFFKKKTFFLNLFFQHSIVPTAIKLEGGGGCQTLMARSLRLFLAASLNVHVLSHNI